MSSKSMSLKERINNYAKKYKIAAQVVLQNYMLNAKFIVDEQDEKALLGKW